MGFASSKKAKTIRKLEETKRNLKIEILKHQLKNEYEEKELTKLEMEKQQLEFDIVENQKMMSKIEQKNKAKILLEKIKDSKRKEREIKNMTILSNTLKDNLQFIESKLEEIKNEQNIKEVNLILEEIGKMDLNKIYTNNYNLLQNNKEKDQANMKILKEGNDEYLSSNDEVVESADDILKRLLKQ